MTTNDVEVLRGEIISIGTEILLGALTDTNANHLASQLPAIGIGNYRVTTVGDNQDRLARVFQEAWNRSDVIVATGGLGPTEDDVTREAIAQFMGEELYSDPTLEKELREFFDRRGIAMAERNLKQTMLIPSAQPLPNPRGTAPGWWVEKDGKVIVSMPGVPREMYSMWEDQAVPRLRALLMGRDAVIHSRTIKTFGLSEASVDERLGELLHGLNPTIGVYAKSDGIHIRLTARASTETDAAGLIRPVEDEVNDRLSAHLWGQDADTLEAVIQRIYTERGLERRDHGILHRRQPRQHPHRCPRRLRLLPRLLRHLHQRNEDRHGRPRRHYREIRRGLRRVRHRHGGRRPRAFRRNRRRRHHRRRRPRRT